MSKLQLIVFVAILVLATCQGHLASKRSVGDLAKCLQPFGVKGPCDGSFLFYSYNEDTEHCESFVYGGCEGSENRFEMLSDCEETCQNNGMARKKA